MDSDNNEFGAFVAARRKELGITMRAFAEKLGIAPSFLSEIENGRRPVADTRLEDMASLLQLWGQVDRAEFFDLAARARDRAPADISQFIKESDLARVAMRRAKEANLSEAGWEHVLQAIDDARRQRGSESGDV
ncbi:helix-turn-helix transcriptional regulator [Canibacter sp. lx-72]|uniref:helix-turn-helix domain-containing protein n=1 Tax=Canibacter zhuwentaonis TaxID=2837491 RepID=UPI001BDBBAAD|nr:helix-turn-helix transcriptional regulator [Canibacter zhuwentaonis]